MKGTRINLFVGSSVPWQVCWGEGKMKMGFCSIPQNTDFGQVKSSLVWLAPVWYGLSLQGHRRIGVQAFERSRTF